MVIKRDRYLNDLIDRKHNGMIKVVTGIRRCGKSFLLNELFYEHLKQSGVKEDKIIKFAFDSEDDLALIGDSFIEMRREKRKADPKKFLAYINSKWTDDGEYYLLLDEIQELSEFEFVLNGFLYKRNVDVYVTGSNSKFLSKDVITEFRGRGDEVRVYPLSFSEFCAAYNGDKYSAWREYSLYGGMPGLFSMARDRQKIAYLDNLFKETYLKDIVERNKIYNNEELEEILDILASSIGSLTNPQKIVNTFKSVKNVDIANATVKRYLDCLEDAFIVNSSKRYDIRGRKYIGSPSKYYFTDIGLRNARINFRQNEPTHIMENIIYNELIMRGYSVDVGIVEYRERIPEGKQVCVRKEVDFVCNLGSKRYYIQSAFAIPDREKMEQECASLNRIDDSFKKIIVVQDNIIPYYNEKGYLIINIFDFLLGGKSFETI